ncbi:hypothetical protein B0H14DRAFT_3443983 [Mycena olivaceomarginata]|nr:hypothetical protein B0H14DRAFT_3443983 [Mycena olivaceomarginata]
MASTSQSIEDIIPFTFFNAPNVSAVGADALLDGAGAIDFNLPPYRLTDADVLPTPGRPLLTVSPSERGPSRVRPEGNSWPPFYFLSHPAIHRLMPFVQVPARVPRTDPTYLATILDRAVPVFETIQRSYVFIPHSRAQLIVLAGLLRLVSAVSQIVPARVQSGWTAFLPVDEPASSPTWNTYPPLSTIWVFPGTEEFPMDQSLRDPFSVADHTTLLRIARPNLRVLVNFMARNRIREANGPRMAVSLLDEALAPVYPIFEVLIDEFRAGRLSPTITHIFFNSVRALIASLPPETRKPRLVNRTLTPALVIPRLPNKDLSSEPYPVMDMSDYNSMWYWWQGLQDEHPSAVPVRGAREESTSPHYRPTTPPSVSPAPNPATPPSQTGPSAVGSASFDIRALRGSARKGTPSPRRASAIAASPSHSAEMQVDSPEMSSADALAIAEALDDPPPRRGPPRVATRGQRAPRRGALPVHPPPASLRDTKGRPMTKTRSSQRSVTPPASEAYNEDGEEEKEDEEEEEEPVCPAKRQRTSSSTPKGRGRAQLLLDSQRDLSVDYRTAVLQYPFISDPRRTESTTDGDLAALINFLEHRDVQAHQPTPPPEESSKWPEEDESASSGSE